MPVGFRGAVLSAPGVAAYIDDSQATSAASVTTRSVAIVGVAERGIPNTAVAISNASTARAVYGSGSTSTPLVDGIIRALNAGAGLVYGIRVGRAKPFVSSLTKNGVEGIGLVTNEYGKFAKSWYLTVGPSTNTITQNSVSTGKKVSITIDSGVTYSVDNIGKSLVNIIGTSTLSGRCEVTSDKINLQRSANETASFTIGSAQTFAVGGGTGCTITVAGSGATTLAGATVGAAGTGYAVDDILNVTGGTSGQVKVATTNATGGVLTITIQTVGSSYTAAATNATTVSTAGISSPVYVISVSAGTYTGTVNGTAYTSLAVGQYIVGTGIPAGTTITGLSGGSSKVTVTGTGANVGTYIVSNAVTGTSIAAKAYPSSTNFATYGYNFSDYPRLESLINAINADGVFVAQLASGASLGTYSSTIDQIPALSDAFASNVGSSSGTPIVLTANVKGMVDAINNDNVLGSVLNANFSRNVSDIPNGTYLFSYYIPAVITGSISGSTLTVSATSSGALALGNVISGQGVIPGTTLQSGSGSTWTVSTSQDASFTGSISGQVLTVTAVASGTIRIGQSISNNPSTITNGTIITGLGTGSGNTGTYIINNSQAVASGTITATVASTTITATGTAGTIADFDPSVIASDWTNAFTVAQSVDSYLVIPMTDSSTYHATALAHVNAMSMPKGNSERLTILGGALGETATAAKARAAALNNKRAVLVWPGIQDYDVYGNIQVLPPYYFAAQLAGILSFQNDPSTPLTNKIININGIETVSSPSTIDDLVNNGVFTFRNDPARGFVVVQSLTTWTGDLKFARREISTVRAADATMKLVRGRIAQFVGSKNTMQLQSEILRAAISALNEAKNSGYIVDDPTNPTLYPAYNGVNVRTTGDAIYVDFNISPAKPANYILITAYVS